MITDEECIQLVVELVVIRGLVIVGRTIGTHGSYEPAARLSSLIERLAGRTGTAPFDPARIDPVAYRVINSRDCDKKES